MSRADPSEGRLDLVRAPVLDRGIRRERDLEDVAGVLGRQDRLDTVAQADDEMACPGLDDAEAILRDVDPVSRNLTQSRRGRERGAMAIWRGSTRLPGSKRT